jgi:hypothetical protein
LAIEAERQMTLPDWCAKLSLALTRVNDSYFLPEYLNNVTALAAYALSATEAIDWHNRIKQELEKGAGTDLPEDF